MPLHACVPAKPLPLKSRSVQSCVLVAVPTLLLWGPRPPPGGEDLSGTERAHQAVHLYRQKLADLAQGPGWYRPGSLPQLQAALQAFVGRWLSAARAAHGSMKEVGALA